jgi:hypothetical protein
VTLRLLVVAVCALVAAAAALAADSTDPKVRITKADEAKAAAAVLRFNDLGPAWSGGATKPTSLKAPICPGNQPNDSDLTITGHAESLLTLESAGLQVDTDAEVFKTPAQVAKLVKRTMGAAITGCLKYNLLRSVGTGATIGATRALTVPKAGDRALAYRVGVAVKPQGSTQAVEVFSDYLFVSAGRTQFFVNLIAPASAGGELPALENRIAKLLASRAA